LDTHSYVI